MTSDKYQKRNKYLAGALAGGMLFLNSCASTRPVMEARTNGNGDLETRVGVVVGAKEKEEKWYSHKKPWIYVIGAAVAGGIYALTQNSGGSSSSESSVDYPVQEDIQKERKDDDRDYSPNDSSSSEPSEPVDDGGDEPSGPGFGGS